MGLSKNDKYVPVDHFRDRLEQRYQTTDWKAFMAPCYPKMEKDEAITKRFNKPYIAYRLNKPIKYREREIAPIIVVNEHDYKLITIFESADNMEDIIADELQKTVIQAQIASAFTEDSIDTLMNFAKALNQEHQDLIARSRYKYAQQVLKESQSTFLDFFNLYNQIATGFPTTENQEALKNFKGLKKNSIKSSARLIYLKTSFLKFPFFLI